MSLDESRRRFTEGVEQVRLLLERENVSHEGEFHRFRNVTSLPRPTQKPRPPFWTAAIGTPQSFADAGRNGYGVMAIRLDAKKMAELFGIYREAWRSAGHPGRGAVMNSFLMCCMPTRLEACVVASAARHRVPETTNSFPTNVSGRADLLLRRMRMFFTPARVRISCIKDEFSSQAVGDVVAGLTALAIPIFNPSQLLAACITSPD